MLCVSACVQFTEYLQIAYLYLLKVLWESLEMRQIGTGVVAQL